MLKALRLPESLHGYITSLPYDLAPSNDLFQDGFSMDALLVLSDVDESALLSLVFQRAGFYVRTSRDMEEAISSWTVQPADALVWCPPKSVPLNGVVSSIKKLRAVSDVTTFLVCERLQEDDHLRLLQAGVDLVVERPYSARLLIAQVKALMRRTSGMPFYSLPTLALHNLTLDPAGRTVTRGAAEPVHLTQLEFRLLYTLMMHPGQVIPVESLVENVWGYTGQGDRDLVRGLIRRLRTKVEPDPSQPTYIQTVPGIGYLLKI
ncbi:MAG: response regulator transcription factor [Anaerolineales bacterium]